MSSAAAIWNYKRFTEVATLTAIYLPGKIVVCKIYDSFAGAS